MTDLMLAKRNLFGHTICLCRKGQCLFSEKRGIAPMMNLIADEIDLSGYSVADLVVGKAAAMLFVRSGIKAVFARTISEAGRAVLKKHGIRCEYGALTDRIMNWEGTDVCPMEKAVLNTENIEEAYERLKDQMLLIGERR